MNDRKESSFSGFCAEAVSKKASNNGWLNQLMQISGVSEPIAKAIVKAYPSFSSLMAMYECDGMTEKSKMSLLANLERETSNAVKRIGPSISKKIYMIFTEEDGSKLVQDL